MPEWRDEKNTAIHHQPTACFGNQGNVDYTHWTTFTSNTFYNRTKDVSTNRTTGSSLSFLCQNFIQAPNSKIYFYVSSSKLLFTNHILQDLDAKMFDKGVSNFNDIIMGGDRNVIIDPELDKTGGNLNINQNCADKIDLLMTKYNLNDTWRIKNPCTRRYTWRQSNPLIQYRLDYWLISDSLFDKVVNLNIKPSIRSDHSAITVQFENIPSTHNGPNFWKLNSNLLKENDYTQTMGDKLKLWCEEYNIEDKRLKWEIIKFEIRKFTIEYCKRRSCETNERQKRLERQLCELERNLTRE